MMTTIEADAVLLNAADKLKNGNAWDQKAAYVLQNLWGASYVGDEKAFDKIYEAAQERYTRQ
jgi:hypothetical protein